MPKWIPINTLREGTYNAIYDVLWVYSYIIWMPSKRNVLFPVDDLVVQIAIGINEAINEQ